MNRRKFLWTGAIFVPAAKSIAQAGLRSPAFVGRLNKPAASAAAPSFGAEVQRGQVTSFTTSTEVITLSGGISAGKRAVLLFQHYLGAETVSSVTDSKGNTWTIDYSYLHTTNHRHTYASSHLSSALVASDTITVTFTASHTSYRAWMLCWLSDVATSSMVDQTAGNATYGTAVTVSAATTAAATQIVCILESTGATTSTYSGSAFDAVGASQEWTASNESWYLQKTLSTAGTKDPGGSWNANATWGGSWVAYK